METDRIKVGVFGSADQIDPRIDDLTTRLGNTLAEQSVILITGACPGVPYKVALAAYQAGYASELEFIKHQLLDE